MNNLDHGFCIGAASLFIFVGVGMNMENNQSPILYIPRKEFIRVMTEIMSGGGTGISANEGEDGEVDEDIDRVVRKVLAQPHSDKPRSPHQRERRSTLRAIRFIISKRAWRKERLRYKQIY